MDLRKCILKKQSILTDTSFGNISNISTYESAAEDTDNSIYYSFVDESDKSVDAAVLDVSNEADFSGGSHGSDIDKENTIIERETGIRIIIQAPTPRSSSISPNKVISVSPKRAISVSPKATEIDSASPQTEKAPAESTKTEEVAVENNFEKPIQVCEPVAVESKTEEVTIVAEETKQADSLGPPLILTMEDAMIVDRETISPMPPVEIIVEDVNGDKINPFTSPDNEILGESAPVPEKKSPVVAKRSTRRSSIVLKTKPRFYSPIMRKSLERKTKAASKLASNPRRTVYEPPTRSAPPKPTGKTPTRIPKPATKAVFKPKALKCPFSGCTNEFATGKALVDHQKTHKPTTASQAFPCQWCDKKFQLQPALFNHQTEKCTKIPVAEKRKVLDQQQKKEVRRRTTIFAAPMMTKKKSPRKLKPSETPNKSCSSNKSMNKSSVSITPKLTPKKSLKCHICKEIIADAIGLANHILSHKFEKLKQGGDKETA